MAATLTRHGSENGYKAEINRGDSACERCLNAHRVYGRQFRAAGRKAGLKYSVHDVIDHLYTKRNVSQVKAVPGVPSLDFTAYVAERSESASDGSSEAGQRPSLTDRFTSVLGRATSDTPYVSDYSDSGLTESTPDPDPIGQEWSQVGPDDEDFVVTEKMLKTIQENMGTYLSVIGMTAEMVDPYCGSVLAANFENMVQRWSKVVVHYPKAANLFLDGKGGVIFAWIGALQATWPVIMAIFHHHLARDIAVDKETGNVFRRRKTGESPEFDATTPPMPDQFDYTVR